MPARNVLLAIVVVVLAIAAVLYTSWVVHRDDDEPEHEGATEEWHPIELMVDPKPAEWDENAQLHAALDAAEARLRDGLDALVTSILGRLHVDPADLVGAS